MSINHQTIIKSTPLQVIQTITNPEFIKHVSTQLGGEIEKFEIEGNIAEQFTTNTITKLPTNRLPEIAQKILGKQFTLHKTEEWESPQKAKFKIKISGAPISVKGTISLKTTTDNNTEMSIAGEISSNVPLMGKKISNTAEPFIQKALTLQTEYIQEWQEKHPTTSN